METTAVTKSPTTTETVQTTTKTVKTPTKATEEKTTKVTTTTPQPTTQGTNIYVEYESYTSINTHYPSPITCRSYSHAACIN